MKIKPEFDLIPEDARKTPELVAKYAKRNYDKIAKFYEKGE